jgi:hypothetical protein
MGLADSATTEKPLQSTLPDRFNLTTVAARLKEGSVSRQPIDRGVIVGTANIKRSKGPQEEESTDPALDEILAEEAQSFQQRRDRYKRPLRQYAHPDSSKAEGEDQNN